MQISSRRRPIDLTSPLQVFGGKGPLDIQFLRVGLQQNSCNCTNYTDFATFCPRTPGNYADHPKITVKNPQTKPCNLDWRWRILARRPPPVFCQSIGLLFLFDREPSRGRDVELLMFCNLFTKMERTIDDFEGNIHRQFLFFLGWILFLLLFWRLCLLYLKLENYRNEEQLTSASRFLEESISFDADGVSFVDFIPSSRWAIASAGII